ncbi:MAG: kinase-like domain-containing protein, partial [Olpidium bornovanus]
RTYRRTLLFCQQRCWRPHREIIANYFFSQEVLNLFCQISLALHHIHACNILHRDLKTTNILISGTGVNKVLKIGDFGISKQLGSKSKADTVVGTPSYISPELCEGKRYACELRPQKRRLGSGLHTVRDCDAEGGSPWSFSIFFRRLAVHLTFACWTHSASRIFCDLKEVVRSIEKNRIAFSLTAPNPSRSRPLQNLLALVLKIMRGSYEPLSSKYSRDLDSLLQSLINLNPSQRPDMTAVISAPFLQAHIIDTQLSMGRVNPVCAPPLTPPPAKSPAAQAGRKPKPEARIVEG